MSRKLCSTCNGVGCWECAFIGHFPPGPIRFPEPEPDNHPTPRDFDNAAEAHAGYLREVEAKRCK